MVYGRYTKNDQKQQKSLKMVNIQIQSHFWNQFWSLIPKMVSDFNFFCKEYHFFSNQSGVFLAFLGTQKQYFWHRKNKSKTTFGISDQN